MKKKAHQEEIKLTNVRLSFPKLFEAEGFRDPVTGIEGPKKYGATFIIDKSDKDQIKLITDAIKKVKELNDYKCPSHRLFLKNGDDPEKDPRPELEGCYYFSASSSLKYPPVILNRDLSRITDEDNVIYGGCYVNAFIKIYPLLNKADTRIENGIYATLLGVQFVRDGEPFGVAQADVSSKFEALDDIEDDSSLDDLGL